MRPLSAPAAGSTAKPAARTRLPFTEREAPFGYALVLPAILYLTAFIAYPFVMSVWLSLTDAQAGAQKWNYVGMDNYSKVDSYDLVANDFVLFDGKDEEAKAFAAAKKEGKVVTAPDGARFKAAIEAGGHAVPVVSLDDEGNATYVATTILEDLDWQVHGGMVVAHAADSPLGFGNYSNRADARKAEKEALLVKAKAQLKANGTGVQQDPNFILSVKNTLKYTFGTELIKLFFGIPCALLLHRKFRGRQVLRGLLVIPWVIPIAISGQAWLWILDSTYSVINWGLVHAGVITPQNILNFRGNPDLAMLSLVVINVWRGFPFTTVVILAGLTSIPDEILERARLDGTNALQRFVYVMAPMVRPILMVSLLFSVVFSFTDFNTIWIITRGGPYDQTQMLATYAYQVGVNAGYLGKGAAISLFLFPIMAVTVFGMLQSLRRENM
jgi:multiple sugar transport system permease protein